MTSDSVRSSKAATSYASRLIVSERRTVTSLIFFSSIVQPKKYRHRQGWRAGLRKMPKHRRETLEVISGGFVAVPVGNAPTTAGRIAAVRCVARVA